LQGGGKISGNEFFFRKHHKSLAFSHGPVNHELAGFVWAYYGGNVASVISMQRVVLGVVALFPPKVNKAFLVET
jgi:hypothetical protein